MLKRIIIVAAAVLATTALARVDVQCRVDGLQRSVEFATGSELNRATSSFRYSNFKVYALLWFSQSQVAILEHTGSSIGISGTFDARDLETLFRIRSREDFKQVNGNSSRTTTIECKSFGRWIDPRLR